jgi:hypothetical protein
MEAWAGPTLAALAGTSRLRAELEQSERRLIGAARSGGATWGDVAGALGLGSRQAAEQRWLRLGGGRHQPRSGRAGTGSDVKRLRALIVLLHNRLLRLADDDPASAPLRLAGSTLGLAADAPPGALHDLAARAIEDLDTLPSETLAPGFRALIDGVAQALTVSNGPA